MKRTISFLIIAFALVFVSHASAEEFGMYVKVLDKAQGSFDEVVKNSEQALAKNGWQILASYNAAVPEGCGHKAHTLVIHSPAYAEKILSQGVTAAFALPLRVGIYTDENGISISYVNPASLNRTVLGDNAERALSVDTAKALSAVLTSAVKGRAVNQQTGEIRNKGYVGGMGGGAFLEKILDIYKKEDAGNAFRETAAKVKEGIVSNSIGWRLVYTLDLGSNIVIYGVDKPQTEARALQIAGEKRESKINTCPGVDHASAFPIEVIVYRQRGLVKVVLLDEMYRMKVYFEDAGKWAFMKNMGMPGSIEKEITAIATAKLK